jgi:putative tryptophan/tyrosine transport system substrate-binding protein
MRRREFITLLGGGAATAAWPLPVHAQQPPLPIIGLVSTGSAGGIAERATAFRKGLSESGYVEGKNVTVEYHWLEGQNDRLAEVMADLVKRQVAVIAAPGSVVAALAAKAATTTIPIVFAVPENPVQLGLVANLARPGGNATGVNTFSQEVIGKRLGLLHDLVPKAVRFAVIVNPNNASSAQRTLRELRKIAPVMGLQMQKVLNAASIGEIDAAFAVLARERSDALFVAPDAFFNSRGVQFSTLAARERIPAAYGAREIVAAGGLMSYGADLLDMSRQVGVYAGSILKGAKPADLPVLQSTKFRFAINLQTARTLGIEVPPQALAVADEVIE